MTSLFYLSTLFLIASMLYTALHMIFHLLLSQVSHLHVYTCDAVNLTDDAARDAKLTAPEVCAVTFIHPDYMYASNDPVHMYMYIIRFTFILTHTQNKYPWALLQMYACMYYTL